MYYILHFLFSYYSLVLLSIFFFVAIYCYFKVEDSTEDSTSKPEEKPYLTLVHRVEHDFDKNIMITGGQARLILWCHLKGYPFPKGYIPRDEDYVKVDPNDASGRRGIIRNEGVNGVDMLIISSIQDYFYKIDLINNQVVVEGDRIYLSKECLEAFINNTIVINPWQLRKGKNRRFMLLRACIQAGYDIDLKVFHPRHGACLLSDEMIRESQIVTKSHWYYGTYRLKMNMIMFNKNH